MQERTYNKKCRTGRSFLWILSVMAILLIGGLFMASSCSSIGASAKGSRLGRMEASTHYKNGRFMNTIPANQPEMMKAMAEWIQGRSDYRTPDKPISVESHTRDDFAALPASGLRITWLGHSTSLIEIDGKRLLTDPMWSDRSSPFSWVGPRRFFEPPLAIEDLPQIDAVLISHDHYDHLDKSSVERLDATDTRFIVPLGVGAHLEAWGVAEQRITELDWWESTAVDTITITATPARHFSGRSLVMADRDKTLWAGFAMTGTKHRVYYTGDSGLFDGLREIGQRLGPFDATLIEVGAYNRLWADLHLGPEQAVQAVKMAHGGLMIPVHWGTFDLAMHSWTEPAERLLVASKDQKVSLAIPRPGESIQPSNPPVLARWWPEIPWQTEKEHPVVSSGITTAMLSSKPDENASGVQSSPINEGSL